MYDLPDNHPAILRIKELEAANDMQPTGSHHGDPILRQRDINLLTAHSKWITTVIAAQKENKNREYKDGWLPHYPDWIKSRLFWRIRSGKEPLKYPPPRAYSCPWYELIEIPGPHDCFEGIHEFCFTDGVPCVAVAQCRYDIIGKETDPTKGTIWTLGFGPYRFRAWNGTMEYPSTHPAAVNGKATSPCGYIEYTGLASIHTHLRVITPI